ncbi:MAG TPA: tail fiber protein, partial [Chloroflexia bacterium]|nr:tail fiber protein [Chloroflexia bacterium]
MSDQFIAEIRIFPFNFAPTGWAFCNGQLMPISQNTALFALLGTT